MYGHAERKAALEMVNRRAPGSTRRLTLGADKGYGSADFISDLRQMCVTPHIARKPAFRYRRANDASFGLRCVAETAQEDRRTLRVGQNRRLDGTNNAARHRKAWRAVHDDHGRLQSGNAAEVDGNMTKNNEKYPQNTP